MSGPLAVVTRQTKNGVAKDQINLCERGGDRCEQIATEDGYKGFAVLSPDNRQVVFSLSPPEPYGRHRLWISDLETKKTQQLTKDTQADNQSWDQYPLWRPDGKEIAFIRATRDATARKIVTSLQHIPSSDGEPQPLLSTNEAIAGYCYSPDGSRLAAFTTRGLDLIDLPSGHTTTLLAWASIPDRIFRASGMVWFRLHNTIAFALFNSKTSEYELWSVPTDGGPASVVYNQPAVQMMISSRLTP
jgi:dipeptidyl aminopeptidase/acylaminoacyl peptidase